MEMKLAPAHGQLCSVPSSWEKTLGTLRSDAQGVSQTDMLLNPSLALPGLNKSLALSEPYFSPL